ncbi:MAG TPA: NAD(P)/FAD-dependent oxidoreductase [Vicinamibacterales bacterium]|nr:NAD(P)/FAD-dependent oxidoreductase [Vicinamibacterales bacterium]
MRDVLVIGAGPAGLMAARELARRGHDVMVLEEHASIGLPSHCTGLLGMEAFSELDIPRQTILSTARAARFIAPDGSSVLVDADRVNAAIVDRARFDQALADSSRAAGVELRSDARVRRIAISENAVTVTADGETGTITARACVLACGANYRFNRELGLGVPRAFVQSAQLERPFAGPEQVEVHLGRARAPRGFAWVVPFERDGQPCQRLGLMADARAGSLFTSFAADVRARFAPGDDPWPEPRLKILPLGPVAKTYGTRVLAVGDAAGLVKPTTGGGIYYGLLSGQFAAEALDSALQADDLRETRLRAYENRWRDRLGAEIRIGLAFRHLASRFNDRAIDSLVELARVDGIVPLLRQTADFNWHRQSALALLRHSQFRRILLSSLWS